MLLCWRAHVAISHATLRAQYTANRNSIPFYTQPKSPYLYALLASLSRACVIVRVFFCCVFIVFIACTCLYMLYDRIYYYLHKSLQFFPMVFVMAFRLADRNTGGANMSTNTANDLFKYIGNKYKFKTWLCSALLSRSLSNNNCIYIIPFEFCKNNNVQNERSLIKRAI